MATRRACLPAPALRPRLFQGPPDRADHEHRVSDSSPVLDSNALGRKSHCARVRVADDLSARHVDGDSDRDGHTDLGLTHAFLLSDRDLGVFADADLDADVDSDPHSDLHALDHVHAECDSHGDVHSADVDIHLESDANADGDADGDGDRHPDPDVHAEPDPDIHGEPDPDVHAEPDSDVHADADR